jgi:hypothetical protein
MNEKGLPETVRETFDNDRQLAGTFVIFCIGDKIEMKARGLTPWQIVKIMCLLISKII